jgi:hypothetical protein
MKRLNVLIGAALLLCCAPQATLVVAGDKEALEKVEYFPLKVGTTWEYLSGGKRIVTSVAVHEKLGDNLLYARLDTTMEGAVVTEYLTVTKGGLFRVVANSQPWLILKLPTKVGDKWNVLQNLPQAGSLGTLEAQKIKVGDQEYDTIVVTSSNLKFAGQDMEMKIWYAKDVGMVRQTVTQPSIGLDVTLELDKFTPAK